MKTRRFVRGVGTVAVVAGLLSPALVRADDAAPAQPAEQSAATGTEVKAQPADSPAQAAPDAQAAPEKPADSDQSATPKQ